MARIAESTDSQEKKWLAYVSGTRNVQRGLLASFLEREFALCPRILEGGDFSLPPPPPDGNTNLLLLRDCFGATATGTIKYVEGFGNRLLSDDRYCVGLVNLAPELEIGAELFNRGVRGMLEAEASPTLMHRFVKSLLRGELWFPRQLVSHCILKSRGESFAGSTGSLDENGEGTGEEILPVELSVREKEVLLQIGMGATNDQIADRLCISQHTVKSHVYRIFRKLNVPNRLQAALWASKFLS